MTDLRVVVLAVLLGILVEALRLVRPGQVLLAPGLLGRYGVANAPRLLKGEAFAIHLAPLLPSGPTLRLSEFAPAEAGSAAIAASPADRLDPERARVRIERLRRTTAWTVAFARLLALHLILLVPLVLLVGVVAHRWRFLGVSLAVIEAGLLVCFILAHRRLRPGQTGQLVQQALTMLLFPPAGVFAADHLVAEALPDVHPLAAVLVVCSEDEARRRAAAYLRHWRHPLPGADREAAAAHLAAARRILHARGWDPEALAAPPRRHGPASAAYCPRCHAQYVTAQGECPDCPGVGKVAFAATAPASR